MPLHASWFTERLGIVSFGDCACGTTTVEFAAASDQPTVFSNQTIREIVHTTIGGSAVRIRLSNTFGTRAIHLDAVFMGLQKAGLQKMGPQEAGMQEDGAALVPRSNHEVTFGGSRSIAIPEGAEVLSDSISFSVGSEQNLAISFLNRLLLMRANSLLQIKPRQQSAESSAPCRPAARYLLKRHWRSSASCNNNCSSRKMRKKDWTLT